ncbi:urea ABC transporter permease subunit UrtB [Telluria mixta]|uniref:Urea ABC transporter permease subunit UrtB n=1 Tax=Telluria mixta TaxID=34071 RepID=A0ABT2C033_9BURK|nr:urea ABC transporter permease subunit UrtB [Telluria mixta]MCS0630742.1 urea ABC transporter permease subunit UrtB [Telluria mixta]WEM98746.1 urea ABC transporter permease subunit UrtB [Telluria mixta]
MKPLFKNLLATLSLCLPLLANAALDPALLQPLAGDDPDARVAAVARIAATGGSDARQVLQALLDDALVATPAGQVLIVRDDQAIDAATGKALPVPDGADGVVVNNRLRGAVQAALSGLALLAPARDERLAAVHSLQAQDADPAQAPLLRQALARETDTDIKAQLAQLVARADLESSDPATRLAAVTALADSGDAALRPQLQAMLTEEPDAALRAAAGATLRAIDGRVARNEVIGNLFYGVSLGSVLLLAALGLAITFGLMGIINMAHGELLMIGAYTTYVCQSLFRHYLPGAADWYLVAALPAAFLVAFAVGVVLERSVIRWLYGRPLETLLATWGISLMLMQAVRTVFGAQNVEVANPAWMSGGVTVLGSLVLPYNRIAIIVFAALVVAAVWLVLNRTRLGLFVRAVMQNRRMADCVGVPTGRIDMMTFGLGSGIAGLGGVALSQLGNVGPDLGQSYIVDSFMVVVLGGVGQLAGTVLGALGLGEINKFLEPVAGAVMAKICILVVIIVFIQRRPQGLFALKGRSVE